MSISWRLFLPLASWLGVELSEAVLARESRGRAKKLLSSPTLWAVSSSIALTSAKPRVRVAGPRRLARRERSPRVNPLSERTVLRSVLFGATHHASPAGECGGGGGGRASEGRAQAFTPSPAASAAAAAAAAEGAEGTAGT